jgi:hypothetical protein
MSCSFTRSSISRNDESSLMSVGLVGLETAGERPVRPVARPSASGSLVAPLGELDALEVEPRRAWSELGIFPSTPRPTRARSSRRRACASPSSVCVLLAEVSAAGLLAVERVDGTSAAASSKKSATRWTFSSELLSELPAPTTLTSDSNSAFSAGISESAFSRPTRLRAMPQWSHMILPSSRWNQSTERVPLVLTARLLLALALTSASASSNALGRGVELRPGRADGAR